MSSPYLTMIKYDGEIKIAHIHWFNGYPENVGIRFMRLLRKDACCLLRQNLHNYKILEESAYKQYLIYGFAPDEEAIQKDYPSFVFEGGDVLLERLMSGAEAISCYRIEHAYKGDICWAYMIDYDTMTFEIYKGFNREPLKPTERFFYDGQRNGSLYPIRLMHSYHLNALPTDKRFLSEMEEE